MHYHAINCKSIMALLVAGAFMAAGCGSSGNNGAGSQNQSGNGVTTICDGTGAQGYDPDTGSVCPLGVEALPFSQPDATETADLEAMRQEEKLARDVYLHFADRYGVAIFSNIASSEQTHTSRIKELLDKYAIADPATDDTRGVFRDQAFTDLYNQLVARGEVSVAEAYQVGWDIEVLDIGDLDDALARTDNDDIELVYQNLRKGSENHKAAFERLM